MEPATQDYLRRAAIDALNAKADKAALELLAMLHGDSAQLPAVKHVQALPAAPQVVEGPAHDYHYWIKFIREQFIPFLQSNGRFRFTSYELLNWIERCSSVQLTTGDVEQYESGKEIWRNITSNALANLKKQGVVKAPPWGKEYEVCSLRLTPAPQYNLFPSATETA